MKVRIELEGEIATIDSDDITAMDCLGMCMRAMAAVGFHNNSVTEAVHDKHYELNEEERID